MLDTLEKTDIEGVISLRLAKNVYAVLDLFHPIGVNAGFIVTKRHIVHVDSGHTIPSAQTIYGYSKAAAPENEPAYLIFTDHHTDHIFGMKVFREAGARTLGHARLDRWLTEYMIASYKEIIKTFGLDEKRRELKYGDVELFPLDETVDRDRVIEIDGEEIDILTTPGHWEACLSLYLPASRILFAGDTIYSGFNPTTRFGNKELWKKWINSLEKLSKLDIRTIVPGHGRICGKDEIPRHIRYLEDLLERS